MENYVKYVCIYTDRDAQRSDVPLVAHYYSCASFMAL